MNKKKMRPTAGRWKLSGERYEQQVIYRAWLFNNDLGRSHVNHRSNSHSEKLFHVSIFYFPQTVLQMSVKWKELFLGKAIRSRVDWKMKFNLFNCKAFRKKKHVVQGGAILDEVISESCSPQNKILLYKLANYKLGEF